MSPQPLLAVAHRSSVTPESPVDSHGRSTRQHVMDPVDGKRAGDRRNERPSPDPSVAARESRNACLSFAEAVRFVSALGELPGVEDHPPRVDIRHDGVTVQLLTVTETYDGMTERDVDLARAISALARKEGLPSDPSAVQSILVIPGAPPGAGVAPFWRAVLGYEARPDGGLMDTHHRGPGVWIEPTHEARPDGGGALHLAIWVPYEEAEARVAAALAAGGRLVRDQGPAWWTIADPAGNEADIATTMGRD